MTALAHQADVAVIGASLGGVVAAWRLCMLGQRVLLAAEHPWLGGQMTAQGVPPDEHAAIERGGACASYLQFREAMRAHYRAQAGFKDHTVMTEGLNPGDGWVSRLCIEPAVAARWFEDWLAPHVASGRLQLVRGVVPVAVQREGRRIVSVTLRDIKAQTQTVRAAYFIDATDTGALLPLAALPYRLGKESRDEFEEPDAPVLADALDQQPVTHVMAVRLCAQPGPVIAAPAAYAFWRAQRVPHYGHAQLSLAMPSSRPGQSTALPLFGSGATLDWWRYRRVVAAHQWPGAAREEVSLVNWAANDHALQPLLDGPHTQSEVGTAARELSLCLLHWLQTEAPRDDGHGWHGWPELQLAVDMLGTHDGLAQQVYVRESRRIHALRTLHQRDIAVDTVNAGHDVNAPMHDDTSVGVAWYNLDIHPTCRSGHGTNARVRPFVLPLGSFVAGDVDNLLPGCKNIGVSHLVNACTRVHPVEWLVGEVAAHLASRCVLTRHTPTEVHRAHSETQALQRDLQRAGIPLAWRREWLSGLTPH